MAEIEPTVALKKVQVQTIAVGDVGLADGGKMARRPTTLKPLPWPACLLPPEAIGFRPFRDRQRSRLAQRGAAPAAATAAGDEGRWLHREYPCHSAPV